MWSMISSLEQKNRKLGWNTPWGVSPNMQLTFSNYVYLAILRKRDLFGMVLFDLLERLLVTSNYCRGSTGHGLNHLVPDFLVEFQGFSSPPENETPERTNKNTIGMPDILQHCFSRTSGALPANGMDLPWNLWLQIFCSLEMILFFLAGWSWFTVNWFDDLKTWNGWNEVVQDW